MSNPISSPAAHDAGQIVKAHGALMLAMLIWSSTFIALKVVINDISPMIVIFLRMAFGSAVFLLAWRWVKRGVHYKAGDWKYFLAMVLFEPCFYFIFEGLALKYTSAGQAGMVTAMLPLMVALAAFVFLKEHSSVRQLLGFIIAIGGVVWMTLGSVESEQASDPCLGNSLEFLAMVCATGYTLMMRYLTRHYPALFLTAIQSFAGAIFFLPLALASDWPVEITVDHWLVLAYLGVVVSLGGYGLFNYSLTYVKSTTAAGYVNLIPAISLIYAMVFLGERLSSEQWIAVGVIFAGVLLSREKSGREETSQEKSSENSEDASEESADKEADLVQPIN